MSEVIRHTPKLWSREVTDERNPQNSGRWFLIWCPGCGYGHTIPTPRWSFNGDFNLPTFGPSVRHFFEHPETKQQKTTSHYHISAGKIAYCGDCDHQFNGQTIEMAGIPPDYGF